jgi:hypothetical protein
MNLDSKRLSGDRGAWVYRRWSDLSTTQLELSALPAWLLVGWAIALTWLHRGLVVKDTSLSAPALLQAVVFWLVAVHVVARILRTMGEPNRAVTQRLFQPMLWMSNTGIHLPQGNEVATAKLVGETPTDMQPWRWAAEETEVRVLEWSSIRSIHLHPARDPGDRALLEFRSADGDRATFVAIDRMDASASALAAQAQRWCASAARGRGWRWLGRRPRALHMICVCAPAVFIWMLSRALVSAYGDWFELFVALLLLGLSLLGTAGARVAFAAAPPHRRFYWMQLQGIGMWLAAFAFLLIQVWFA